MVCTGRAFGSEEASTTGGSVQRTGGLVTIVVCGGPAAGGWEALVCWEGSSSEPESGIGVAVTAGSLEDGGDVSAGSALRGGRVGVSIGGAAAGVAGAPADGNAAVVSGTA